MTQVFQLIENGIQHSYYCEIPTLSHPMLPFTYIDARTVRPFVFHDFSRYIFEEAPKFATDFQRFILLANHSIYDALIDRFKDALIKICEEHITMYGRLVFSDLLMYVDCMGFACKACKVPPTIKSDYPSWVKYVVDRKQSYVKSSMKWGPGKFEGSQNQADLMSCL